jgi:hypothetical protein
VLLRCGSLGQISFALCGILAGDLLREALAIHGQLGMTASADRVAALLEETGAPPLREARSTPPRGVPQRPT